MKTFIATLGTETNTFSPIPTGWAAFRESLFHRSTGSTEGASYFAQPMQVWRREAERRGYAVAESLSAFAQPAGPTSRAVWGELRDTVLDDLAAAGPVDLVLLHLHGAMVAEGCDDCEGDLLRRIRDRVGPQTVIGVELDLHCHLTEAMVAAATVVVLYKEYPHVDVAHRALDLFALCDDALAGRTAPVMALQDCRMLGVWRTTTEPSRGLVDRMAAREGRDGILSMSFCHGFPWADVPDVGAKVLAVADRDPALAARAAAAVAREIWDFRDEAEVAKLSVAEAVEIALAPPPGLTVLADVSDNAGAGAASDSTFLLSALLDAGATRVLLGCLWDPAVVRLCAEAGEGATLTLRLGRQDGAGFGHAARRRGAGARPAARRGPDLRGRTAADGRCRAAGDRRCACGRECHPHPDLPSRRLRAVRRRAARLRRRGGEIGPAFRGGLRSGLRPHPLRGGARDGIAGLRHAVAAARRPPAVAAGRRSLRPFADPVIERLPARALSTVPRKVPLARGEGNAEERVVAGADRVQHRRTTLLRARFQEPAA